MRQHSESMARILPVASNKSQEQIINRVISGLEKVNRKEISSTLPGIFFTHSTHSPEDCAFRNKLKGIWRSWTWAESAVEVCKLAAGLKKIGVAESHRVAIIGHNHAELYWAMIAIQLIGAQAVPIHPDVNNEEFTNLVNHLQIDFIFCDQIERIVGFEDQQIQVAGIITLSANIKTSSSICDTIYTFKQICDSGANIIEKNTKWLSSELIKRRPTDWCLITFTSGQNSAARAVVLSHAAIIQSATLLVKEMNLSTDDEVLAFLPISSTEDQAQFFASLVAGSTINTPESPVTVFSDISYIAPSFLLATPNVLAKFWGRHEERMSRASAYLKKILKKALSVSYRVHSEANVNLVDRLMFFFVSSLFINPILQQMGFSHLDKIISTSAPLPNYLRTCFMSLGLNVVELYNVVEAGGPVSIAKSSCSSGYDSNAESIRVSNDGSIEISVNANEVKCLDASGKLQSINDNSDWFLSGDQAEVKDGFIHLTGRTASLYQLDDGTIFQPEIYERLLSNSPYVRAAFLYGNEQSKLKTLFYPASDRLEAWARQEQISYAGLDELCATDKVQALFRDIVSSANLVLESAQSELPFCVKEFIICAYLPRIEKLEITRNGKVLRKSNWEDNADLDDELKICCVADSSIAPRTIRRI